MTKSMCLRFDQLPEGPRIRAQNSRDIKFQQIKMGNRSVYLRMLKLNYLGIKIMLKCTKLQRFLHLESLSLRLRVLAVLRVFSLLIFACIDYNRLTYKCIYLHISAYVKGSTLFCLYAYTYMRIKGDSEKRNRAQLCIIYQ